MGVEGGERVREDTRLDAKWHIYGMFNYFLQSSDSAIGVDRHITQYFTAHVSNDDCAWAHNAMPTLLIISQNSVLSPQRSAGIVSGIGHCKSDWPSYKMHR